jgi:hypothetical protein
LERIGEILAILVAVWGLFHHHRDAMASAR